MIESLPVDTAAVEAVAGEGLKTLTLMMEDKRDNYFRSSIAYALPFFHNPAVLSCLQAACRESGEDARFIREAAQEAVRQIRRETISGIHSSP